MPVQFFWSDPPSLLHSINIEEVQDLHKKAFVGLLRLLITLAALLFLPAWTVHYWQAWIFLSVFSASVLAITIYLMRKDPNLLQRRVNAGPAAEKRSRQKTIQFLASLAFIVVIIFPALDHRFAWSRLPPYVAIAGDVLVALGLLIIFFVFKENTFSSWIPYGSPSFDCIARPDRLAV